MHKRNRKAIYKSFETVLHVFLVMVLATGCGCPEAEREIEGLQSELKQVRSQSERWAKHTAKLGKAFAARRKWMEKVNEHRKLVWKNIKKLSEESQNLRNVELEALRTELRELQQKNVEIIEELAQLRTTVDVINAAFAEAEKKAAANVEPKRRVGGTNTPGPQTNVVDRY